jgi:hypothetical protein
MGVENCFKKGPKTLAIYLYIPKAGQPEFKVTMVKDTWPSPRRDL